ncbi:MAG: hypothetical protein KME42_24000 [Tildeniella nuda ZEHNDER 1965/U140]|jgi:hypothetical protein|nr:hypothetical protein [Tildeniella nuda ZEHNDER 1965/U140]
MLKPSFYISLTIACASFLAESAIALPLTLQSDATTRLDPNAPLCYIQFQGSSAIDVSSVCGKQPGDAPTNTSAIAASNAAAPPVFDPKVVNASTTGQCNFVDANGNPCPRR